MVSQTTLHTGHLTIRTLKALGLVARDMLAENPMVGVTVVVGILRLALPIGAVAWFLKTGDAAAFSFFVGWLAAELIG